jgi:hypothetical protein
MRTRLPHGMHRQMAQDKRAVPSLQGRARRLNGFS